MEFAGLICLILVVGFMIFFRRPVARTADYAEKVVIVNTKEGELELTERANDIANRLKEIGDTRIDDLDSLFASKGIGKSSKAKAEGKEKK